MKERVPSHGPPARCRVNTISRVLFLPSTTTVRRRSLNDFLVTLGGRIVTRRTTLGYSAVPDFVMRTGFYLAAFLRKISPSNAAHIVSVELKLESRHAAADILPLFAEILGQHVKGLRRIITRELLPLKDTPTSVSHLLPQKQIQPSQAN